VKIRRVLLLVVVVALGAFALIQLVPYGRDHTNPPVVAEPAWDSARTEALARDACFACHSNETEWPWYTNVAPMSWLVQHDVDEGRATLNFSDWNRGQFELEDIGDVVREGEMPPTQYTLIHADARLTDAERQQLAAGLEATVRSSPPGSVSGSGSSSDGTSDGDADDG
jgi:mono/diheme cytochrome c family protein